MKEKLLDLLACPTCGGDILLAYASKYDGKEIIDAVLTCKKCTREYKVVRGVPRFVDLGKIEEDKAATAENFGWQWTNFTQEDPKYNEQFLGWLQPVTPGFFEGKVVLEGGCGKGRHTKLAAQWGATEVVGIDLGLGVESAFALTREMPNAHIVQCDIFKLPFKKAFDYAFSVGVLHHTPDTKLYTNSLIPFVKPGGRLSIWVYPPKFARRGEWVPMASHLPLVAFKEWCEWAVDIARENKNALWLEPMIKQFPFSTHHANSERSVLALFDGFSPTFHWTHSSEEVTKWFHEAGLVDVHSNAIETSVSGLRPRLSDLLAIGDGVSV